MLICTRRVKQRGGHHIAMTLPAVDLGRLDLVSTTSGLRLQLSSSAHFAPSVEDDHDPEALTAHLLTSVRREWPWICRGSNCRLVLRLQLAGDIDHGLKNEMLDRLTTSIGEAEVRSSIGYWRLMVY